MRYASDLDGHQPDFHRTVHIESCSPWIMLSDAPDQHCLLSDMIIFETSQQISLLTSAQMLDWSQLSSPSIHSTNTEEWVRIDIKAQNFRDSRQRSTYFDVRVFNSFGPSNISSSTSSTYHRHKREKRRAYEQRILQMEHGIFTPLILSTGTLRLGCLQETGQPNCHQARTR